MLKTETVKVVKMSDVLNAANMNEDDCELFYQNHLSGVTWGDADYTLVHMNNFLGSVLDFLKLEHSYTQEQVEIFDELLTALVPANAYVNLEA